MLADMRVIVGVQRRRTMRVEHVEEGGGHRGGKVVRDVRERGRRVEGREPWKERLQEELRVGRLSVWAEHECGISRT